MRITAIILMIIFAVTFTTSCSDETTTPTNDTQSTQQIQVNTDVPSFPVNENALVFDDRLLGINISDNENGFFDAFEDAQKADIDIVELNIPWNAFEPKNGKYQDPWDGVLGATAFYGEYDIKVALSIALINTVAWELPSDLEFTDKDFTERFCSLIDFIMSTVPDNVELNCISIGNEVDFVLQDDEWGRYTDFVKQSTEYIHQNYPGIVVGVKTTVMNGILGGHQTDYIKELNNYTDVVMLNYYPQNEKFQVLEPDIIHEHFDTITAAFPNREIWITEIGYQSGSHLCKSSELKQAEFFHEMFEAWDNHSDQIKVIQIDWLHEQSPQSIKDFSKYYGNDKALIEYLSTLGLRNYDDTDKLSWIQILYELDARNKIDLS